MEFSPEDNQDNLPGGKKKNKKEVRPGYVDGSRQESDDRANEARSDILRLFTKNEVQDVSGITEDLYDTPAKEKPEVQDSEFVTAEDLVYADPESGLNGSDYKTDNLNTEPFGGDQESVPQPGNPPIPGEGLYNKPRTNTSWEQANQQLPEPVRPVYGYNPDGNEFYKGYVPGVPGEKEADTPIANSGGGGANVPPRTPNSYGNTMPEPEGDLPSYGQQSGNVLSRPAQAAREAAAHRPERTGFSREEMVAAILTTMVVTAYLKNRKIKRQQKEFSSELASQQKQINQFEDESFRQERQDAEHERHIKQVEDENRKLAERLDQKLTAHAQATPKLESQPKSAPMNEQIKPIIVSPSKPLVEKAKLERNAEDKKVAEQLEMIEAARKALEEADSQHSTRLEQDAWLRHELDEHGNEVQGQQRGQEYTHERAQELMLRQPQNQQTDRKAAAEPFFGGSHPYPQSMPNSPQPTTLNSGQTPADHRLPYTTPSDSSYRRSSKHNPLVSALTSPWTFLMLSIILLAYFIATLL